MKSPLSQKDRERLGPLVKSTLEAAKSRRANATQEWMEDVSRYLRGDVDRGPLFPLDTDEAQTDVEYYQLHYPVAEPRRDAIVAQVSTMIGKQNPIMVAVEGDMETRQSVETAIQRAWTDADFPTAISKAADICVATNAAVYCISPSEDDYMFSYGQVVEPQGDAGIYIGVLNIADMVSWGEDISGIENALMIGHRYSVDRGVAMQKVESGEWAQMPVDTGRDISPIQQDQEEYAGINYDDATSLIERIPELTAKDGTNITMWCLYVKVRGKDDPKGKETKWLKCTVGNQGTLFNVQEHPMARHPYFVSSFLESPLGDLYPERSIGRMLYELQSGVDQFMTILVQGAMMQAMPAISGMVMNPDDKDIRPRPNEVVPIVDGKPMNNQGFNPAALWGIIQSYEKAADQVSGASQNTLGTANSGAGTATENSIIASGVQTRLEDMLRRFTKDFSKMARYTCELMAIMHSKFSAKFVDLPEAEDLLDPSILWQVNGTSANQTPAAKKAALQEILATAQTLKPEDLKRLNTAELMRQVILQGPFASMVDQIMPEVEDVEQAIGEELPPDPNALGMAGGGLPPVDQLAAAEAGLQQGAMSDIESGGAGLGAI